MTGQKLYRLTFKSRTFRRNNNVYWECLCDCGNVTYAAANYVRRGRKKSCGCLKKEEDYNKADFLRSLFRKTIPDWEKRAKSAYRNYRQTANKRNFEFDLDFCQFLKISSKNCDYCGSLPNYNYGGTKLPGEFLANGIDRIDSSKGYSQENIVPCCKDCNIAKNTLSVDKFLRLVKNIAKFKNLNCLTVGQLQGLALELHLD